MKILTGKAHAAVTELYFEPMHFETPVLCFAEHLGTSYYCASALGM